MAKPELNRHLDIRVPEVEKQIHARMNVLIAKMEKIDDEIEATQAEIAQTVEELRQAPVDAKDGLASYLGILRRRLWRLGVEHAAVLATSKEISEQAEQFEDATELAPGGTMGEA